MGKVINNTIRFIGRNLILSLVFGVVFFVLPLTLVNLWAVRFWPILAYLMGVYGGGSPWSIVANLGSALASGLLVIAANFLGFAVLSRAAIDDINGSRPSVGGCIQAALRHCLPIMGIGFAIYLLFFFASDAPLYTGFLTPSEGLAVLIASFIFWGLGMSVAVPVEERLGRGSSMSRSRALTRGYRWPIFVLFSIVFGLWFVTRVALAFMFRPRPDLITSISALIVGTIPSAIVSAITWTVTSIAITATYVELRRIKEGTSVEDLAEIFS
ncbi:hypothetical protein [Mesorhizobium hawassense]|uniref:hypothetical protein n=1 Tax=Mesorhizobium hawassense TaxID=1209954 RepID=UPI0011BDFCA5|nr:hypothetical protein [Mesorhizobium hawassense]